MWDLIVSIPDHCLSFYLAKILTLNKIMMLIWVRKYTGMIVWTVNHIRSSIQKRN